ncbi:MAG: hypothetical protein DDT37_01856 [Firmicutes bacterium]|nr:hypothetical protein [candidate division NPL-UPA2 bacterium]
MPSTIPRFKGALLARLQADAGLAGIQISWGNPHPARLADELIIIDAATALQTSGSLGARERDERYRLDIIVSVSGPARATQQSLEERAFALAAVIEKSITDWRESGLPQGVLWVQVEGISSGEAFTPQGDTREASVFLAVAVIARMAL